jgi:hypothetical protein
MNAMTDISALGVAATGATELRTLADRFADQVNLKDFGAKGDGITDDTSAVRSWLTYLETNGGVGFAPPGNYLILSNMPMTIGGVSVKITGTHVGAAKFIFNGAIDGFSALLTRKGGVWGAIRFENISVIRNSASPAQANTGIRVVADPSQGIGYTGNSGMSDVFVGGNVPGQGTPSWQTGVYLADTTDFELRDVYIFGANATGDGSDVGLSIFGSSKTMFSVQSGMTDCQIQGFSTGIYVTGNVQGVFIENSGVIGNWRSVNWQGSSPALSVNATAAVGAGTMTIYVSPADAATLSAAQSNILSGSGVSPRSTVTSINTTTGAISLNTQLAGAVAIGDALSFSTGYLAEALNISNSTFGGSLVGILANDVGFVQITNSSIEGGPTIAPTWAGIELDECNNCNVVGNQILGSGMYLPPLLSKTGIIIRTTGGNGNAPNTVVGNAINGIYGYGIKLAGTVCNTTVMGNPCFAVLDAVNADVQIGNMILGNKSNTSLPEISLNPATKDLDFNAKIFNFAGNLAVTGSVSRSGMASCTPTSGSAVKVPAGVTDFRILGSTPLQALTIELPSAPGNGLFVHISSQVAINALTVQDGAGNVFDVQTPPSALAAGTGFNAQWNAAPVVGPVWWCSVG